MNCSIDNQWNLANNGLIQADADIVGAGVLTSFIATAFITFLAVLAGYLTFSLPEGCTSRADDKIVKTLRRCWGSKRSAEAEDDKARAFRIESLRGFLLSLSDQQLATGAAMLVAGFARYSNITVYSMNTVSALAFFSSSVHLGTLSILSGYLRKHNVVKSCRVVAMSLTLVLLLLVLLLQVSGTWSVVDQESDLFLCCALPDFTLNGTDLINVLSTIFVMLFLLLEYLDKFVALYSKDGKSSCTDILLEWWRKRYGVRHVEGGLEKYRKWALRMESNSRARTAKLRRRLLALCKRDSSVARAWVEYFANRFEIAQQAFIGIRVAESFAFYEAQGSQAWEIGWLLFANVYGTAQVFVYRGQSDGTTGPFNTMGFGQIVPLALLVLPLFAALESIYGYRDSLSESLKKPTAPHSQTVPNNSQVSLVDIDGSHYATADPSQEHLNSPANLSMRPPSSRLSNVSWTTAHVSPTYAASISDQNTIFVEEPESIPILESRGDDQHRVQWRGVVTPERPISVAHQLHALAGRLDSDIAPLSPPRVLSVSGNRCQIGRARWRDTEARLGLGNSSTTDNDLAHIDPEKLLAKFMHEEPLDVGRIEGIMCMYFILFYLFLVFLALATAGVGVLGGYWLILSVFLVSMEIRVTSSLVIDMVKIRRQGKQGKRVH